MSAPRDAERVLAALKAAVDRTVCGCSPNGTFLHEPDCREQEAREAVKQFRRAARGGRDGGTDE